MPKKQEVITVEQTPINGMTSRVTANGHTLIETPNLTAHYAKVAELQKSGKSNAAEGGWGYGEGNFSGTVTGPGPIIEMKNGQSFIALVEVSDIYNEDTETDVTGATTVALANGVQPAKGEIVMIVATKGRTATYAKAVSIYTGA